MNSGTLSAAGLHRMVAKVVPSSPDAEQMVDSILGIALRAFDLAIITEAEFRDVTSRCLDALPPLAR